MNTGYTTKVIDISLTKLHKLEVYTLYTEVMEIINSHDTTALHIDTVCEVLLSMHEKAQLLASIEWNNVAKPLTEKLAKIRENRFKFAALITNHMRSVEKAGLEDVEFYIKYAKPEVNRYLLNLRENKQSIVTQMVMQFFDELDNNPQLNEALQELGFTPYLNQLKTTQEAFLETYDKRRALLSKRHKGSTQPIQRELLHLMSILFKQLDYYQHVYKDIDYSHIISSINYVIASYNKLIKTRHTKRTNKKIKAIEEQQAALEEQLRMEVIEHRQTGKDTNISTIETILDKKKKLNKKLSIAPKKRKEKEKPIDGLLDILKKSDEGKKDNYDESDEDDE